jgi:hypothetical protein
MLSSSGFKIKRSSLQTLSHQAASIHRRYFYTYPAGGKATKKITKGVTAAQGAVVSLAAK